MRSGASAMSVGVLVLAVAAAVSWLVLVTRVGLVAARMFQIEEYESLRFLRWGMARPWLAHRAVLLASAVSLVALVVAVAAISHQDLVVAAGWLAATLVGHAWWRWSAAKRALVLTARMRRLLGVAGGLAAVYAGVTTWLLVSGQWLVAMVLALSATVLVTPLTQTLLVAANFVLKPAEAEVQRYYLRRATAKLRDVDPLVVAVAGSYGKTSTKHILAQLLQPSIETLPTRKSFNTLMGVTRAINEDLAPRHRIFLVEMDAYAPGEIAGICRLVKPKLSILTSVGPQHLERLGTAERVADALLEVISALPFGAPALVYAGDPASAAVAQRARYDGRYVVRYGIDDGSEKGDVDVVARDVVIDSAGARFRWAWPGRRLERDVAIPLLGMHQVLNVTAALAAVALLGHSVDAAVEAAASLQPIEHRLQLLATGTLTVLDDTYNANPVGMHNALDVLAAMKGGLKVLVTPGMVELGPVEDEENRRYGAHAATVCDHVILVASVPARAVEEGLHSAGFAADRIHIVRDLAEVTAAIQRLAGAGDVVLFANDLPDTYSPPSDLTARAEPGR